MTSTPHDLPVPKEDLPIWMRRAMRGNDYGALFTVLFSALIAWFFITGADLPRWNATENYVYMTADYAAALQEGRLYPRWAAYADSGYGAPIYHYYPPGTPYLTGIIAALFTGEAETAVSIVYLLAFMLAGIGVYGLVVRHRGAAAAMLAAMLYVTSPYIGLTAPHILGDLPGSLALGLLPVLLWSTDRLVSANHPQDFLFVTGAIAALLLTDPRVALVGIILAMCLTIWHITQHNARRHHGLLFLIAVCLSALIAGFYWIPALAELDAVRWVQHDETSRPLFLTLSGIISRYHQPDPLAILPQAQLSLGWLRWLIALLSIIGVLRVQRQFTTDALFLVLGVVITALTLTLFPTQIWLLGVITLCFAVSSGAALALRTSFSERMQRLILAVALLVILGTSAPSWLPPVSSGITSDLSPLAQVEHEQSGYGVAVVPSGSAYPSTLQPDASASNSVLNSLEDGAPSRIDRRELSSQLRVSPLRQSRHNARYQIDISTNRQLTLLQSYFPGWRAWLDGEPLPLMEDPQTGLTAIQLPSTTNSIMTVRLGATSVRRVAWVMSITQLVLLLYVSRRRYQDTPEQYHEIELLTLPETRLMALIFAFSALIVLFTAAPDAPLSVRVQPGNQLNADTILDSRSNVGISLLGYELPQSTYRPGDTLPLTLYWSTLRELTENYRVQVSLYSETDNTNLTKPATRYPGGYPPTRWMTNRYVRDPHNIAIGENIPSGTYILVVTLEPCAPEALCDPNNRPIFFEPDGTFIGRNYVLPQTIQVVR